MNRKILIVEDEIPLLKVLSDKLVFSGFDILEAKNGKEGLDMATREHPDLILLDIVMPKMNGLTMLNTLRKKNSWGKNVPVILLTNLNPDDEKVNKRMKEGEPSYYLVKADYTMDQIVEKIREKLPGN